MSEQNPQPLKEKTDLSFFQTKLKDIHDLIQSSMKENIDYGTIPHTKSKPTLLKPGAEKLCGFFELAPKFTREIIHLNQNNREYRYRCELYHIKTNHFAGSGDGSCSTLESQYKNRTNIPDTWNTAMKVAQKRAFVAATLIATGTSEIFTQDIEDVNPLPNKPPKPQSKKKPDIQNWKETIPADIQEKFSQYQFTYKTIKWILESCQHDMERGCLKRQA